MKITVGIWFVVISGLLGELLGKMDDEIFPSDDEKVIIAQYDVIVIRKDRQNKFRSIWAGVILNERYVLSVDPYAGQKKITYEDLNVIVGYHHIGKLIDTQTQRNFDRNKGIYEIAKIWLFRSVLLMRTKNPITYRSSIQGISLPKGENLVSWRNPFVIPRKGIFTTSYWCRQKGSDDYYFRIISEKRNCSMEMCFRNDGLIPSCLSVESYDETCILAPGAPLVYDDILVGVRKERYQLNPSSKIIQDYFINLTPYKKVIDNYMEVAGNMQPAPMKNISLDDDIFS